jgi:hypothetical protein
MAPHGRRPSAAVSATAPHPGGNFQWKHSNWLFGHSAGSGCALRYGKRGNTSIGLLFFQTLGPHGWTVSAHPIVTGDEAASLREKKTYLFSRKKVDPNLKTVGEYRQTAVDRFFFCL